MLPRDDDARRIVTFVGYLISRIDICNFLLEKLQSPEVVDVEDAFEAAGGIYDEH
jgi:hypothetical protein